jgi:Sec-independent protein secretion pathway component TatC
MADGLSLAGDSVLPISSHLDELLNRLGLLLFALTVSSIIWIFFIDSVLAWYLIRISPCPVSECLSVFAPAEWVSLRWMSALLLGSITIIPLFCWQAINFTRPGMLPQERHWLSSTILIGGIVSISILLLTMLYLIPMVMLWAHQGSSESGVVATYDAVEILRISFAVLSVELIVLLAMMSALMAGVVGLLDANSLTWFRIRIHGFSLALVWLSIPSHLTGIRLLSIISCWLLVESCISPFKTRNMSSKNIPQGEGIMDSEGSLRRIAVVSCACAGACPKDFSTITPDLMATSSANALCLNAHERNDLLASAKIQRLTDLIITGCDGRPLPEHMKQSLDSLSIKLRGLSLLNIAAARPDGKLREVDFNLALASMVDPWPKSGQKERIMEVGFDGNLTLSVEFPWGLVLHPNDAFACINQQ